MNLLHDLVADAGKRLGVARHAVIVADTAMRIIAARWPAAIVTGPLIAFESASNSSSQPANAGPAITATAIPAASHFLNILSLLEDT